MKLMKVFDCQQMPDDIRQKFFESVESPGNDCYVHYYVSDTDDVSSWLISQGATIGENVIVEYWW